MHGACLLLVFNPFRDEERTAEHEEERDVDASANAKPKEVPERERNAPKYGALDRGRNEDVLPIVAQAFEVKFKPHEEEEERDAEFREQDDLFSHVLQCVQREQYS